MAHAQKPDFVFPRNGRVHLNRWGTSVQSTAGSRGVRVSLSNAGYTTFGGGVRVLATHSIRQFPLHFPSRSSPCATRFRTSSTTPTPLQPLCKKGWVVSTTPRLLPHWKYPSGWMGLGVVMDEHGKPRPHWKSIPRPANPQQPLCWLRYPCCHKPVVLIRNLHEITRGVAIK